MTPTMSIFRREFAARRDLFVLAAAVMVIAVMMPVSYTHLTLPTTPYV